MDGIVDMKIAVMSWSASRVSVRNLYMEPAPFQSLLMEGCVANGRDISLGCTYNHYGIHGTGIATAVDSLAAVRNDIVFEDAVGARKCAAGRASQSNFESEPQLMLQLLRHESHQVRKRRRLR
jgi:hypothetical protein